MMNKILTVGHPQSGYRDVERILLSCGMQEPEVSKKDNLSPVEIGELLRKAHGLASVADISQGDDMQQLDAGPVWNGLALDLLMGNIDQKFWGWSDPEAIWLLDYWKSLDPKMAFVLVYDDPHRVLREMGCEEAQICTREKVERQLENWNAYNQALLAFYLRNQDRSMLVNARQVRKNADAYLNQLQNYLDKQVCLSAPPPTNGSFKAIAARNGSIDKPNGSLQRVSAGALAAPALADGFLIDSLLVEYPEHLQCYEELQASATIPLACSEASAATAFDSWSAHMRRRSETGHVIRILSDEKQSLEKKLHSHKQQVESLQEEARNGSVAKKELGEENALLLSQLHQVQEELERYYLENEKNKGLAAEKERAENLRRTLEQEKQSLEKKLHSHKQQVESLQEEARNGSVAKKELGEENALLLSQLHQVQEELERYYLENQRLKQQYEPTYYGAAERLKSELPYQLGAAIIKRGRKVWPLAFLPLSITRLARQHQKDHQATGELPPLTEYRDYPEAEKAQKHLSFRLGSTWLKHSRTPWGWAAMPFDLTKVYREFRAYRASKDN